MIKPDPTILEKVRAVGSIRPILDVAEFGQSITFPDGVRHPP
jgi:hypothetical protein